MSNSARMLFSVAAVGFPGAATCDDPPAMDEFVQVAGSESGRENDVAVDAASVDAAWSAEGRAVVYLVAEDGRDLVRRAAATLIRDRWSSGDWALTHVFVSDVPGKAAFAARRRAGLRRMAVRLTEETGQTAEFVSANEERIGEQVRFVHDPDGTVWARLLEGLAGRRVPAVVLLDRGRVVRTIVLTDSGGAPGGHDAATLTSAEADLVSSVRRLLPEASAAGHVAASGSVTHEAAGIDAPGAELQSSISASR